MCLFDVKGNRVERKWQAAPICGENEEYLKVWCTAIGLRGRTEASRTIG